MHPARLLSLSLLVASLAACEEDPQEVDLPEGAAFLDEEDVETEMFSFVLHDSLWSQLRTVTWSDPTCLSAPGPWGPVTWEACATDDVDQQWRAEPYIGTGGLMFHLRHLKTQRCLAATSWSAHSPPTLDSCASDKPGQAWTVTSNDLTAVSLRNPSTGKDLSPSPLALDPTESFRPGYELSEGDRCMYSHWLDEDWNDIWATDCDGSPEQRFLLHTTETQGRYHLESKSSGGCLYATLFTKRVVQTQCGDSWFLGWGVHYDWSQGYYRLLAYQDPELEARIDGNLVEADFQTHGRWLFTR